MFLRTRAAGSLLLRRARAHTATFVTFAAIIPHHTVKQKKTGYSSVTNDLMISGSITGIHPNTCIVP